MLIRNNIEITYDYLIRKPMFKKTLFKPIFKLVPFDQIPKLQINFMNINDEEELKDAVYKHKEKCIETALHQNQIYYNTKIEEYKEYLSEYYDLSIDCKVIDPDVIDFIINKMNDLVDTIKRIRKDYNLDFNMKLFSVKKSSHINSSDYVFVSIDENGKYDDRVILERHFGEERELILYQI